MTSFWGRQARTVYDLLVSLTTLSRNPQAQSTSSLDLPRLGGGLLPSSKERIDKPKQQLVNQMLNEAEGKGGRPNISFSYNIARAIIILLPLSSLTVRVPIAINEYRHVNKTRICINYKYPCSVHLLSNLAISGLLVLTLIGRPRCEWIYIGSSTQCQL